MLTTSTTPPARTATRAISDTPASTPLTVALQDAHQRFDAALSDLRRLVAGGKLTGDEARALEAEYAEVHLLRVAALEQVGARACTAADWQRYVTRAARDNAARARRERLRHAPAARQCLVVAPGRIANASLAALVGPEPDSEILEIRAELAAAQLL